MNDDLEFVDKISRSAKVSLLKRLSRFFSIDLTVKVFGYVIYALHYPPITDRPDEDDAD